MTDNNKHGNKTEELLEKKEARQFTEEELEQVTGGLAPDIFQVIASIVSDMKASLSE